MVLSMRWREYLNGPCFKIQVIDILFIKLCIFQKVFEFDTQFLTLTSLQTQNNWTPGHFQMWLRFLGYFIWWPGYPSIKWFFSLKFDYWTGSSILQRPPYFENAPHLKSKIHQSVHITWCYHWPEAYYWT